MRVALQRSPVVRKLRDRLASARQAALNTTVVKRLLRLATRLEEDNISLVAAGVAFHVFLSIFPALAVCGIPLWLGIRYPVDQ